MVEIKIDKNNKEQRLDKFLLKYLNKSTKSFIYKMLRKKNIKLNDQKADGNEILKEDDVIKLFLSDETINKFREYKNNYENYKGLDLKSIIYEDQNILIINKMPGIIVHSATNDENENTLINSIIKYLVSTGEFSPENSDGFKPAICNRLDVNTSGIIVAGKNLPSVQSLNEIFKNKTVEKIYETIVIGNIKEDGEIRGFHKKNEQTNTVEIFSENLNKDLKEVYTKYFVLKNSENFTHLKIKLITGKTHQIRASLENINHSIIGDRKYGNNQLNSEFKKKYGLSNQLLHASSITFCEETGFLSYLNQKKFIAPKTAVFKKIEENLF